MYAPQLSNCFPLIDSRDICTATFKQLASKWLKIYTLQLSYCLLLNDSWDVCTATFKLLPSKWLLRDMHHNFYTASFLISLKIDTLQLSHCFLLNDSWEICTTTLHCFLLNDSGYIYTATFTLLPCKWLLRDMHRNFQTASILMNLKIYTLQLSNCFLLNDLNLTLTQELFVRRA